MADKWQEDHVLYKWEQLERPARALWVSSGTSWDMLPSVLSIWVEVTRGKRTFGCLEHQGVSFPTPSHSGFILRCQKHYFSGLLSSRSKFLILRRHSSSSNRDLTSHLWVQPYWLWGIWCLPPQICFVRNSFLLIPSAPTTLLRCIISHFGEKK